MNRKQHRSAEALRDEPSIEELRGIAAELDHVFPQTAAPRSILVCEPDGTETIIGDGPIGAYMTRAMVEKLKALPEVKRATSPRFRFGGIEFEEWRG